MRNSPQAMLNRFWKAKADDAAGPTAKRPYLSSECDSLPDCEHWRAQIIREISRKVAEIQNGALVLSPCVMRAVRNVLTSIGHRHAGRAENSRLER